MNGVTWPWYIGRGGAYGAHLIMAAGFAETLSRIGTTTTNTSINTWCHDRPIPSLKIPSITS